METKCWEITDCVQTEISTYMGFSNLQAKPLFMMQWLDSGVKQVQTWSKVSSYCHKSPLPILVSVLARGNFKLGQLSERLALTQLVGETYCLCNTGSEQDDHSNPLCSGSLGIEEWRCFAFAVACGDAKAPWSFKNFGVFILWAGIMSKYTLFF